MFDDNDPIKDYASSKVSRLFEKNDLSGGNDEIYEDTENISEKYHETQKNNKAFTINEYGINRTRGLSLKTVIIWFLIIWFLVLFMTIYIGITGDDFSNNVSSEQTMEDQLKVQQEIAKIEEENNKYDFSCLDSISFDNGIEIPCIYKYLTKTRYSVEQKYTYSDQRFGSGITTIEIYYSEPFFEKDIELYKQALKRSGYEIKGRQNAEELLIKEVKRKNSFIVVIVGGSRVLYGVGNGNYEDYI